MEFLFPRPIIQTLSEEKVMKTWTRPVIVEIQVGMEINCYVCAEL
ncbi:MAG TPA: pyrroloquinoline quinone precursor peptide PqqA [Gammaproteobacteria bacterium]|nr:pyrroloquinoline quinone precursor peptide PqqA [Gammaproteobacteria bacterium]